MLGKNLDGDGAVEASIANTIHLSHPARASGADNFIRTNFVPGISAIAGALCVQTVPDTIES
jgi:hypothetical protein